MRVLHLASSNRWTGAAAPAFAETEGLRLSGSDSHYAYIGGYKLAQKLDGVDFAHPIIEKKQNPIAFLRSVRQVREIAKKFDIRVLHAHLTYDHLLACYAARRHGFAVVRTFHSRRTVRRDPFTLQLLERTDAVAVINESLSSLPPIASRNPFVTPPPVDRREFRPEGENLRSHYGVAPGTRLLGIIGKVSPNRGFESALDTLALLKRRDARYRLMIIGHGPHRPFLEQRAADLGLSSDVIWAGYHEVDLAEHYRAFDVGLFTAAGSDEGHRAILEQMSCGVPVAAYPIEGVAALLGPLSVRLMSSSATPEALAPIVDSLFDANDLGRVSVEAARTSEAFDLVASAARLMALYGTLRAKP